MDSPGSTSVSSLIITSWFSYEKFTLVLGTSQPIRILSLGHSGSALGLHTNWANKMEEIPGLVEYSGEMALVSWLRTTVVASFPIGEGQCHGVVTQSERIQRNQGSLVAPFLGLIINQLTVILVLFL